MKLVPRARALTRLVILLLSVGRCGPQIALACDNYAGEDGARCAGRAQLAVVLEGDDAPAQRLLVTSTRSFGTFDTIELNFQPLGGSGALTHTGIQVVHANPVATGSEDFFMRGSLSAGPYEYFLFRGADGEDTENHWYLRSSLIPGSASTRSLDAAGNPMQLGAAPPDGSDPLPLYRPEVPLYTQAKALAGQVSLLEIGSYHKRRGEQQSWYRGENRAWLRLYHTGGRLDWRGDAHSRFRGHASGFQIGTNYHTTDLNGHGWREYGLFIGASQASGDVRGFARGIRNFNAGRNQLDSRYLGWYLTQYRPDFSYFDLVVKTAYVELDSESTRRLRSTVRGPQLTVSIEGGLTLPAGARINLEPQLQAVANYTNFNDYRDEFSRVDLDETPEATLRAGLRAYNREGRNRYYLFGNLWHTVGGQDEILFDATVRLESQRRASWAEVGAGLVLLERRRGSAFFNLSYQRSIDSLDWQGGSANLGFNWDW